MYQADNTSSIAVVMLFQMVGVGLFDFPSTSGCLVQYKPKGAVAGHCFGAVTDITSF